MEMSGPNQVRVAFVTHHHSAYADRIVRGMASAAAELSKASGEILIREFEIKDRAQTLPHTFERWRPDAVVAFLGSEHRPLFNALKQEGRPLVHTARVESLENEAIVLANGNSVYKNNDAHFASIGRKRIVALYYDEPIVGRIMDNYRAYRDARGEACEIVYCKDHIVKSYDRASSRLNLEGTLANWLRSLDEPVGIFTQQVYAASHLCRMCHRLGLSVPEDVAIIGTDEFDISHWVDPPQTSFNLDGQAIGAAALRLAQKMLNGKPAPPDPQLIDGGWLIVRGSTVSKQQQDLDIPGAIDYIDRYAVEGISMLNVVEETQGVSRQTFVKQFKASTGMTPTEAIRKRMIDESRRMLRDTDISITAMARICGFCDDTHFRRVFQNTMGCTPSAYRKAQRG